MRKRHTVWAAVIVVVVALAWDHATRARAADVNGLPGTATLSGMVQAPKPFKAAQVHLMNVDKNVLFMVYTSGGRYRAVNLFPGRYEVTVRKPGFVAERQAIVLRADGTETLNFSLREGVADPVQQGEFGFTVRSSGTDVTLVSYDELYPRASRRASAAR